jgi:hypothetical protein
MNKNEVKQLKSSLSSNTGSNILNEINTNTKNISSQKESQIVLNKNNTPKNKSISSNQIFVPIEEDKKSKHSKNSKKGKEKGDSYKNKKRNREKIAKLLKNNERIKIPSGKKRRSFAVDGNTLKLNLNNFNNILKSLTPPKQINVRTDKNGVEINKNNKKLVHITFLDDIPPNKKITDTVVIQSFKKFNIVEDLPGTQNISNCSKCCSIF